MFSGEDVGEAVELDHVPGRCAPKRLGRVCSALTVASVSTLVFSVAAASALPLPAVRASQTPRLYGLRVTSGIPFSGDGRLLATVSPNGDGLRDRATVRFRLNGPAIVRLRVMVCRQHPTTVLTSATPFRAGKHELVWAPAPDTPPQTYRLLVGIAGADRLPVHGCGEHRLLPSLPPAPVVRVMGIDAGFTQRSYAPGALAHLRIATDVPSFTLQFFQAGPEAQPTYGTEMEGVPVTDPRQVDWLTQNAPATIDVRLGGWANGIYFARLTAPNGQNYYAPLIVRPRPFGAHRVAVVLETNTWQAYNHYDANGDGWGDTWYAAQGIHSVDLTRPFTQGGAPPRWSTAAVPFLHWLYRTGKQVDILSDDDLEHFRGATTLSRLYDLIVFAGHEEYVTSHVYKLISAYRDLGGNLMFLSADNFAWRIGQHGNLITRIAEWRTLGKPESRLIGVQYRANDEGQRHGSYQLTPYGRQSWQFAGTDQATLDKWPWFGIEYDTTTSASPPGTHILAQVDPHFPNPAIRGQMTYYQRGRAKVFAAGTLNFTGGLDYPPLSRLLENLWQRLTLARRLTARASALPGRFDPPLRRLTEPLSARRGEARRSHPEWAW
jgi:hypothetical protein